MNSEGDKDKSVSCRVTFAQRTHQEGIDSSSNRPSMRRRMAVPSVCRGLPTG